jgi:hypothetical protein
VLSAFCKPRLRTRRVRRTVARHSPLYKPSTRDATSAVVDDALKSNLTTANHLRYLVDARSMMVAYAEPDFAIEVLADTPACREAAPTIQCEPGVQWRGTRDLYPRPALSLIPPTADRER